VYRIDRADCKGRLISESILMRHPSPALASTSLYTTDQKMAILAALKGLAKKPLARMPWPNDAAFFTGEIEGPVREYLHDRATRRDEVATYTKLSPTIPKIKSLLQRISAVEQEIAHLNAVDRVSIYLNSLLRLGYTEDGIDSALEALSATRKLLDAVLPYCGDTRGRKRDGDLEWLIECLLRTAESLANPDGSSQWIRASARLSDPSAGEPTNRFVEFLFAVLHPLRLAHSRKALAKHIERRNRRKLPNPKNLSIIAEE
jgi:hypothetical protein